MADDVKPYTTLAELEAEVEQVAFQHHTDDVAGVLHARLLAAARAGLADSERLDWLDKEAHIEPLLLHDGRDNVRGNYRGLGLMPGNLRRDLRDAIDDARGSATPAQQVSNDD